MIYAIVDNTIHAGKITLMVCPCQGHLYHFGQNTNDVISNKVLIIFI